MIRVSEQEGLGQLRPAGPVQNEYSMYSIWPKPFPSEYRLLREHMIRNTNPPWQVAPYTGATINPPAQPDPDAEDPVIKEAMQRIFWPRWETFNLNLNPPPGFDGVGQVGPDVGKKVGEEARGAMEEFLRALIPSNPWPFMIGAAGLIGIGSMETMQNTLAKPVLYTAGGLAAGAALISFLFRPKQ